MGVFWGEKKWHPYKKFGSIAEPAVTPCNVGHNGGALSAHQQLVDAQGLYSRMSALQFAGEGRV